MELVCILSCSLSLIYHFLYIKGGFGVSGFEAGAAGFGAGAGAGFAQGAGGGYGSSSYESSSYSSSSGGAAGLGGFDAVGAAFQSADSNKDGRLDASEFNQFVQGGL